MEHKKVIEAAVTAAFMIMIIVTAGTCSNQETVKNTVDVQEAAAREEADRQQTAVMEKEKSGKDGKQGAEEATEEQIVPEETNEPEPEDPTPEEQKVYEIYLSLKYADSDEYQYGFADADGDNKKELCIRRKSSKSSSPSWDIIKYENKGLYLFTQTKLSAGLAKAVWVETADLSPINDKEIEKESFYVYAAGEDSGKRYWYLKEADLLEGIGFSDATPFFENYDSDGNKRLTFYYDEQTQKGCGIRYYEIYYDTYTETRMSGFTFDRIQDDVWDQEEIDYFDTVSIEGTTGSEDIEEYREETMYNENGQITHYGSLGIVPWMEDTEPESILSIDYQYHDNGQLSKRCYVHNGSVFGTTGTTWDSYFDEDGRIIYECMYITHGSLDTYYIYMTESSQADYILMLDHNLSDWIPTFWKGK